MKSGHTCALLSVLAAGLAYGADTAQDKPQTEPVVYRVEAPGQIRAGEKFEVAVTFDVLNPWYIYAPTGGNSSQGMVETTFTLKLPAGFSGEGALQIPKPVERIPYQIYQGKGVKLRQVVRADASLKPGKYDIQGQVRYQTCNLELCLPPVTEDIEVTVEVLAGVAQTP